MDLIPAAINGREACRRDAVDLLYRHGIGSIVVSVLASSGLALISLRQGASKFVLAWWFAITCVLALRGADISRFHLSKRSFARNDRLELWRFGIGVVTASVLWAVYPVVLLRELNQTGRAYAAIVLSGMAGGCATVLAPSRMFSTIFCGLLVLPASILFLTFPGEENTLLGCLGCVFFLVLIISARISNRATMTAIRLSRANEALLLEMDQERARTENANQELEAVQGALRQVNQSLEARIQARTEDLEREVLVKERYAKELAYLASTDSLTGLSNRSTLAKRLAEGLRVAESTGRSMAVLFLDLDNFKEVNDMMGHLAGDLVLKEISARLSRSLPFDIELARWGGDEFVVAIPGLHDAAMAVELAGSLRRSLCDPIRADTGTVTIDATIGIALFPEHGRTQEELIRAADIAMYSSKQDRRTRIKLFDRSLSDELAERHVLERALREAVSTGALSLAFQPILTAAGGRCETLEALARWTDPQQGAIPPSVFIPLAERMGEISSLGRWVLEEACLEAATWGGPNPPAVSVNVSAAQLQSGALITDIFSALEHASLPASRLHLELTESIFAGDCSSINPILSSLRERGISVALDDFGTGFSCLAYLHTLPIDLIKIDKAFVNGIDHDSGPIVKTIMITAQTFGLQVVAEGVETAAQAAALVSIGAQFLQGHLFSEALSPQATREWLFERQNVDGSAERALPAVSGG